jgi:serine/threonine protein phosphatase PrpC
MKVNQDSFILAPNLMQMPALHYFGVADGHGQFGREVSSYVKAALPPQIEVEFKRSKCDIHHSLTTSFIKVNENVARNVPDPQFSGTTCCTVLMNGKKLISANAGDSRAIVVNKDGKARQLTRDHKPDDPDET